MNHKVIFSFYISNPFEDTESQENILLFRRSIITDMSVAQIEDLIAFGDGFYLEIVEGETLVFIDYYSFRGEDQEVITAINNLQDLNGDITCHVPKYLCLLCSECNDEPLSKDKSAIYRKTRFEQGASGLSELVVHYSNDPWIMVVVGYLFGKAVDFMAKFVCGQVKTYHAERIMFNYRGFYKKAGKLMHCKASDLQITDIRAKKGSVYHIRFRNSNGESYKADCYSTGSIIKLSSTNKLQRSE